MDKYISSLILSFIELDYKTCKSLYEFDNFREVMNKFNIKYHTKLWVVVYKSIYDFKFPCNYILYNDKYVDVIKGKREYVIIPTKNYDYSIGTDFVKYIDNYYISKPNIIIDLLGTKKLKNRFNILLKYRHGHKYNKTDNTISYKNYVSLMEGAAIYSTYATTNKKTMICIWLYILFKEAFSDIFIFILLFKYISYDILSIIKYIIKHRSCNLFKKIIIKV